MKKAAVVLLTGIIFLGLLSACKSIPQQLVSQNKTQITLTNYTETNFKELEILVESTYDDIDLIPEYILSNNYTSESERRFRKNAASDLIVVNQLSPLYMQQYLLDLSGYAVCAQYDKKIMDNLATEGKIYAIPLTGYYQGYLYNKTMFEQNNIACPQNNSDLVAAVKTLTAAGIDNGTGSAFGMKLYSMSAFGNFVIGYGVPDFLSTAEGIKWADDFYNKQTTFAEKWTPYLEQLFALGENGIINPNSLDRQRNNIPVLADMATGRSAIAFYPELTLDWLTAKNKLAFEEGRAPALYEYEMLPFLSSSGRSPWTTTTPQCYLAINANMQDEANKEKLDACRRILDLISTNEGQTAVSQDLSGSISYLRGCTLGDDKVPRGLEEVVENGCVYTVKSQGKIHDAIGQNFCEMMTGVSTPSECAKAIDDYYYNGDKEAEYSFSVVGSITADALIKDLNVRLRECELGNLVADSVRDLSEAQIAVVNGGGIRSSLYAGDITGGDLLAACPYDNKIVVLRLSGQTIWDMLENGLSTIVIPSGVPGGRFLQISGASYTFDSTKPIGSRLLSVELANGTPLSKSATYTVAVNDYMAGREGYDEQGNGDGYVMLNVYSDDHEKLSPTAIVKESGKTYRDAITAYFNKYSDEPVSIGLEGRIKNVSE